MQQKQNACFGKANFSRGCMVVSIQCIYYQYIMYIRYTCRKRASKGGWGWWRTCPYVLATLPMFVCLPAGEEGQWPSVAALLYLVHGLLYIKRPALATSECLWTISPSRFLLNIEPRLRLMFHNTRKPCHAPNPNHRTSLTLSVQQPLLNDGPGSSLGQRECKGSNRLSLCHSWSRNQIIL